MFLVIAVQVVAEDVDELDKSDINVDEYIENLDNGKHKWEHRYRPKWDEMFIRIL